MPLLAGQIQLSSMEEGTTAQQPTFTKINYTGVNCINYLSDFAEQDFANIGYLEGLNASAPASLQRREQSKFDNIASELYKKIVKQGYVERPSTVSKKGKRGDTDFNYYNTNDDFIDDEEIIEKKDIFSQYKDYQCLAVTTLEELYNSQQYKAKAEEVVSESLKRQAPQHFNPDNVDELEKFDEIKKKIKNNIKDILNKMGSPHPNVQELPTATAPANPLAVDDLPVQQLQRRASKSQEEPIVIDDDPVADQLPQ